MLAASIKWKNRQENKRSIAVAHVQDIEKIAIVNLKERNREETYFLKIITHISVCN